MNEPSTAPSDPELSGGGGASPASPAASAQAQAHAVAGGEGVLEGPADSDRPGAAVSAPARAATGGPPPLVPPGNRPRPAGLALLLAGGLGAVMVMGADRQLIAGPGWGVLLGFLAVLVASFGVLELLGSFDDPAERVAARRRLTDLGGPLLSSGAWAIASFALLYFATKGTLPLGLAAILVPSALTALVASVYWAGAVLGPWASDEGGQARPLHRRHGFWVVVAAIWMYVPMAGGHSLTDPWETHYGEVSREVLSRDDWISTWWAQDGWFFSKPVLNFWMQALSMDALGVHFKPDQMLAAAGYGATPRPEWAVRLPVVLLATLALYLLYKGAARVFGRRAGLLGALVLMAMPQWALLAHQTMADMPFVAALASSMGLLLLGIYVDPNEQARLYEVDVLGRRLRLSAYHLVFGAILICALPQIFYLASRNVELVTRAQVGFRWHPDVFWAGSQGNCGLPGNEACVMHRPVNDRVQPAVQALGWSLVLGALLWLNRGERRVQRLCFHAAFVFAAISTLGKGPAGFLLPVLCACAYVAVTGKWRELTRLEIVSGLLIVLCVAIPWYSAMYLRHGPAFIDRLIFHDMWKRALTHVHDTNEGDDTSFRFYLWQLGYALFPWTGLSALSLVWWARKPDDADRGRGDASVFLAMWFVFAFALFTWMLTKFHHYIFPAVPPAGMLTGVLVDRLLGAGSAAGQRQSAPALRWAAVCVGALTIAFGATWLFPGSITGFRGDGGELREASPLVALLIAAAGAALSGWGAWPMIERSGSLDEAPIEAGAERRGALDEAGSDAGDGREARASDEGPESVPWGTTPGSPYRKGPAEKALERGSSLASYENVLLSGAAIAAAVVIALVGRDMAVRPDGDVPGDARLLHLFTYNYKRSWPESLSFTGAIAGVTLTGALFTALLAVRRLREAAVAMLLALSLGFGAYCLDVYFVKTAPHWGQRETIEAYYKQRRGPEEPLVAYQMNWKGENFYTGNRIPAFVSSGEKFKTWVKEQRERGVRTFFFTTEHGRIPSLKAELGNPTDLAVLTDRRLNNKFTLVRVRFPD